MNIVAFGMNIVAFGMNIIAFGINIVVFGINMIVFGINMVVFGINIVVLIGKSSPLSLSFLPSFSIVVLEVFLKNISFLCCQTFAPELCRSGT